MKHIATIRAAVQKTPKTLWGIVAFYIVLFSAISIWKYTHFFYDVYDLGIFNQVLWNSVRGDWFAYSFAPYSYLVDHRAWLLIAVLPLYAVVQHPITLLVLQTIVLGSGAILLYWVVRTILSPLRIEIGKKWALLVSMLYLLHPTIQSMNLFEFHLLPFAIPLSFALWLAIHYKKKTLAWVLFIVLLLLREDVALMTAGLGILTALIKRTDRYWLVFGMTMTCISLAWFIAMIWVGAGVAPEGGPKFAYFYAQFGSTSSEILRYLAQHPLEALSVMFGKDHSLALIALLSTFAFLPLFRGKYLLPAVLPATVLLLIDRYLFGAFIHEHYSALLLPWLWIAFVFALLSILKRIEHLRDTQTANMLLTTTLLVSTGTLCILLGPWIGLHQQYQDVASGRTIYYTEAVAYIPQDAAVMTTAGVYANLSSRSALYPVLHVYNGTEHYSETPYTAPDRVEWIVLETEEVMKLDERLAPENTKDAGARLQAIVEHNNLHVYLSNEKITLYGPAQ